MLHGPLRVALVSSILPADATGGEVILHRHLFNDGTFDVTIVDGSAEARAKANVLHRTLARLQKSRFAPFVEDYWAFREGRWLDRACDAIGAKPADVVLTVAHGDAFCAARRFAKRRRLPLVSIYHDWWPDMPRLHAAVRSHLEQQFRQLAEESTRVICVSEGMRDALGPRANSMVLHPIPEADAVRPSRAVSPRVGPYRVGYMGNVSTYGPMLQKAIEDSWKHPEIKIEVRGNNPEWPPQFHRLAKERGNWLDFAKRDVLHDWLEGLDAFLVAMDFAPHMRRRMETSFPSKLTEFAKYGKPVIVWGPEYCSAVRWARKTNACVVAAGEQSGDLLNAVKELQSNPDLVDQLGGRLAVAYRESFEAESNQRAFTEALRV